jgi:surfeit locus 1 family protein
MSELSVAPQRPARRWASWLFAAIMLALTVFFLLLAKWQFDRLAWKEALIAEAAANMQLKPVPLLPVAQWGGIDPESYQYRPVTATGHYVPTETVRVFVGLSDAAKGVYSGPGCWIMTPFALDGGGTVFVNRGFVPQAAAGEFATDSTAPAGDLTINGATVASEETDFFTPAPDALKRIDWVRNIPRMTGLVDAALKPLAPVFIDLPAGPRGALPQGGETEVDYTNNHLGYAYTWLGFALTTIIMLAEWVRRQLDRRRSTS